MTAILAGKYHLEHRLGLGGMAEVYLARSVGAEGFEKQVAIKRVLAGYAQNPRFAEMFVAEARLSSRLQHANIVSILDFARDPDAGLLLVMEYVDGASLDRVLETGPLPVSAVVHVVVEVLRGLEYAHGLVMPDGVRGIVHRDVSPHNVLLSRDGGVKIADFGIAKARMASDVTGSEMIKGKPAYMSPEQANGERLDGRSDLFAVGVMLWEMLCGRSLFLGASTQETLARLLFAPIPSPRSLHGTLPEDVERVTMRLLARDLPARYASASEAIRELIACGDYPRSGREALGDLMHERMPREATTPEIATTARTAADARRRLPAPSEGRAPTALEGESRRGSRRNLAILLIGVAALGAAIALFVASQVTVTAPVGSAVGVDAGATPIVVVGIDAAAPPAVPDAGQQAPRNAPDASVARTRPAPERPATPDAVPPPSPTGLDRDLDEIAKMGSVIDISKFLNPDTTNADPAIVIEYWLGQAALFRRCYTAGLMAMRRESDDLTWMYGQSSLAYRVDSHGVVTNMRAGSFIHEEIKDCIQKGVVGLTGIPAARSGTADVAIDISMITCLSAWELDDKAGKTRRRCPATTSSWLAKRK